jgi:hypothetical protein
MRQLLAEHRPREAIALRCFEGPLRTTERICGRRRPHARGVAPVGCVDVEGVRAAVIGGGDEAAFAWNGDAITVTCDRLKTSAGAIRRGVAAPYTRRSPRKGAGGAWTARPKHVPCARTVRAASTPVGAAKTRT